ncbi:MAG: hypothetical protein AB1798_10560 [Spirochaetota bacterium]
MKKWILVCCISMLFISGLWAFEVGGGISVFVPESLYLHKQGSVSVETNLEYSFGIGKVIRFPIGITYMKVTGLMTYGEGAENTNKPWFVSDALIPKIGLLIHIPISVLYLEVFGGGAGFWNFYQQPLVGNIEQYFAGTLGKEVAFSNPGFTRKFGVGYLFGGAIGLKLQKISIDVSCTYMRLTAPLTMSGTLYTIEPISSDTGNTTAVKSPYSNDKLKLVLSGLSFSIGGKFAF